MTPNHNNNTNIPSKNNVLPILKKPNIIRNKGSKGSNRRIMFNNIYNEDNNKVDINVFNNDDDDDNKDNTFVFNNEIDDSLKDHISSIFYKKSSLRSMAKSLSSSINYLNLYKKRHKLIITPGSITYIIINIVITM